MKRWPTIQVALGVNAAIKILCRRPRQINNKRRDEIQIPGDKKTIGTKTQRQQIHDTSLS